MCHCEITIFLKVLIHYNSHNYVSNYIRKVSSYCRQLNVLMSTSHQRFEQHDMTLRECHVMLFKHDMTLSECHVMLFKITTLRTDCSVKVAELSGFVPNEGSYM